MNNSAYLMASTMGAVMGLAGIEHGIGEVLQGNASPAGIMIESWPNSAFFQSLGGEPAMTLLPNMLLAGILTIVVSLFFLVWSIGFVQRKNGGLIMMVLSILMLLAGGGLFPPLLGLIVGVVAARINATAGVKRPSQISGSLKFFGSIFPGIYAATLIAWPALLFGPGALDYFLGINHTAIILVLMATAFGLLALGFIAGFARDNIELQNTPTPV